MCDDLSNAELFEFACELALSSPSDVLGAVVSEDFLRDPVAGDCRAEDFNDQGGRLAAMEPVAGDKSAMVIHEGHEIEPAILPLEHECEEIGLPKLVGCCAFEAAYMLRVRSSGLFDKLIASFAQHTGHGIGTGR